MGIVVFVAGVIGGNVMGAVLISMVISGKRADQEMEEHLKQIQNKRDIEQIQSLKD